VIGPAAGFFGYTLANVLFLTGLWRYSALQAGLALTIGPVVAVAVAGPASRLAQRIGPRPVLVAGGPGASVRAVRATEVIAVGRADFTELLHASPALSLALNRSLGDQLSHARAPVSTARPRPTTMALIALDARILLPRLAARLGAALQAHTSVAVLSGAEVPVPAEPGEAAALYGPLLDRAEAGHDLVLLVGGSDLQREPWTKFCLQQADRILAVTAGGPIPPELGKYPELRGCDLVSYDAAPGELDGWAAALDPVESHLILLGSENTSEAARRHADLVIRPRAEGVGLFEFQ